MSVEWRPVVGLEDFYEVSNAGLVRGLDRRVPHAHSGSVLVRGRLLKLQPRGGGYLYARLRKADREVGALVHCLVLEAFVGPCPPGMEACHNDGDPRNNVVTNLRWDTHANNILDAVQHGTHSQTQKTRCPQGHPYNDANTARYRDKHGVTRRRCRICARKRARDYWRRRRIA